MTTYKKQLAKIRQLRADLKHYKSETRMLYRKIKQEQVKNFTLFERWDRVRDELRDFKKKIRGVFKRGRKL